MSDTEYCYPPDYTVLINKFGIKERADLDHVERLFVVQRMREPIPVGDFDLAHLKLIHLHLFQDVYQWAGDLRRVEISKDGQQFQFRRFIETGMADIHHRVKAQSYLQNLSMSEFAVIAGEIIGDINYVHPFREGNGRSQLLYLTQLAAQADHSIDLLSIDKDSWMNASRQAHHGNFSPMADCIRDAIEGSI